VGVRDDLPGRPPAVADAHADAVTAEASDSPFEPIVAASAVRGILAAVRGRRAPIVLIDGPSGAGKSTLADAVLDRWPGPAPSLVRLDDAYRGWNGLARAGSDLARTLVPPLRRGGVGRGTRWDWAADAPGALERRRPGRALIIEGCGAFAAGALAPNAVHVWVAAPDALRKRRALERDGGRYDPFWAIWERQWRRYVHRAAPERRASIHVRRTDDGRLEPASAQSAPSAAARA
jgi:hypothetical protein